MTKPHQVGVRDLGFARPLVDEPEPDRPDGDWEEEGSRQFEVAARETCEGGRTGEEVDNGEEQGLVVGLELENCD